jgi:hypothetical protein
LKGFGDEDNPLGRAEHSNDVYAGLVGLACLAGHKGVPLLATDDIIDRLCALIRHSDVTIAMKVPYSFVVCVCYAQGTGQSADHAPFFAAWQALEASQRLANEETGRAVTDGWLQLATDAGMLGAMDPVRAAGRRCNEGERCGWFCRYTGSAQPIAAPQAVQWLCVLGPGARAR